jgi:hypothetical protein
MAFVLRYAPILAAAALAGSYLVPASAEAKSSCVRACGEATMVTQDLAKFMANASLKNSISGMGAKAAGPVNVSCSGQMGLVSCKALQRACK